MVVDESATDPRLGRHRHHGDAEQAVTGEQARGGLQQLLTSIVGAEVWTLHHELHRVYIFDGWRAFASGLPSDFER